MSSTKVSLITSHYVDNYGSILQTYASQKYLEEKGCSVEIVNYIRENLRIDNIKKRRKAHYKAKGGIFRLPFVSDLLVLRWYRRHIKRKKILDAFRKDNLRFSDEYTSIEQLMSDPPIADYYCVGSDQVWNYLYNEGVLPEHFLQYAPKGSKKLSLSSSLGIDRIDDEECGALMKSYLRDFSLITVRESSGKKALESIGVNNVHHVLDPTLLLTKEQWISEFNLKRAVKDEYVLLYQLTPCREMDEFARQIALKKNCKLIVIAFGTGRSMAGAEIIVNPSAERFMELILHANYIVTDSFHATAFSICFNREFLSWLPNKYSTRLVSLLEMLNLEDRAFTKNEARWEMLDKIDYKKINGVLDSAREELDRLIEEVFDGEKNDHALK